MILPVNTAACFSQLKLIKTDLQHRLNQDAIDNLLFIAIEGSAPEDFSYEEAVLACSLSLCFLLHIPFAYQLAVFLLKVDSRIG